MADGATPNYNLTLPEVGASADSWGAKTNDNWTTVDTALNYVAADLGNYLPLSGGTMSGGIIIDSSYGINYAGYGGHWFAFGWDGSFATVSVDNGGYTAELASTAWVNGNFKNIGAYTPNQNVDYNSNPTFYNPIVSGTLFATNAGANHQFSNVSVGGTLGVNGLLSAYGNLNTAGNISAGAAVFVNSPAGVIYSAFGANQFAFSWDGVSIRHIVNGGDQGALIRSVSGGGIYRVYEIDIFAGNSTVAAYYGTGGNTYAYWNVGLTSDRRLKDNIRPASGDALELINSLPVYECDLRSSLDDTIEHHPFSLMTDELGERLPTARVIPLREGAYESVREGPLLVALLRAVQQLTARVAALEAHA